ncbi:MAG: hypothetical protein Q8O56_08205 [Solirubrobacteraceae bacterium]|nr:hypothetical protein [Solirubrobacteraceae bacterium]
MNSFLDRAAAGWRPTPPPLAGRLATGQDVDAGLDDEPRPAERFGRAD